MAEALERDNFSSMVYRATNLKGNYEKEALLKKIENLEIHFKTDEVISILFLLYRNPQETYRDLEDFLNGKKSNLVHKWCKQGANSDEKWESKFYESLFLIKNYKMLKQFNIEAVNAVHIYNHNYLIPNIRVELFKISEHIYGNELKTLITQMKESEINGRYRNCLEMYLLKWINEKIISLDNEVDIKKLADSLEAIGMNNFSNKLLYYQSSLAEQFANTGFIDDYPIIDPNNVGLCLIINQKKFNVDPSNPKLELKERNGTEFDGERLQKLFGRKLKFDVKMLENIESGAMVKIITEKIKNFFKPNHSIFVLIILSHGSKDAVFGSDSKPVSIYCLDNSLKTPGLEGKPKIIIIQACQGDWYVKGSRSERPENSKIELDGVSVKEWPYDTIFCMSTIPLFATCRHKEKGAWYIINLCEVLEKHSEEDLCSILTRLTNILTSEPVFGCEEKYPIIAIPEFKSRLTKKLYLKKAQN